MVVTAPQLPKVVPIATPVRLYRNTPDWSEQNARVPVVTEMGVAVASKVRNGESIVPAPVAGAAATTYPVLVPAVRTGSIKQAVAAAATQPIGPPKLASVVNPVPYDTE